MTTEQRLTEFAQAVATDVKTLYARTNTFEFNQMVPSILWTINHALGKFPSVEVVDSAGTVVVGNVEYINDNQITIEFSFAFSGKAYLN
jgi:hypothetical protein